MKYTRTHTHTHTHTHIYIYIYIYIYRYTKTAVYIIKCTNCNKINIDSTQALNNRESLLKSNFRLPANRKLYALKPFYESSKGNFKIIPIYQTDDYSVQLIQEERFRDRFKPTLNNS